MWVRSIIADTIALLLHYDDRIFVVLSVDPQRAYTSEQQQKRRNFWFIIIVFRFMFTCARSLARSFFGRWTESFHDVHGSRNYYWKSANQRPLVILCRCVLVSVLLSLLCACAYAHDLTQIRYNLVMDGFSFCEHWFFAFLFLRILSIHISLYIYLWMCESKKTKPLLFMFYTFCSCALFCARHYFVVSFVLFIVFSSFCLFQNLYACLISLSLSSYIFFLLLSFIIVAVSLLFFFLLILLLSLLFPFVSWLCLHLFYTFFILFHTFPAPWRSHCIYNIRTHKKREREREGWRHIICAYCLNTGPTLFHM